MCKAPYIPVIGAKIENFEAIKNIDGSFASCRRNLMVARGDLGVEIPAEGSSIPSENNYPRNVTITSNRLSRLTDAGFNDA